MAYTPSSVINKIDLPNLLAVWLRRAAPHLKFIPAGGVSDPGRDPSVFCTICRLSEPLGDFIEMDYRPLIARHTHRGELEADYGNPNAWLQTLADLPPIKITNIPAGSAI
jgi:hypothetical protein